MERSKVMPAIVFCVVSFVIGAFSLGNACAEDQTAEDQTWKQELESDKASIDAQKAEIKTNAETAKSEEKALLEQIRAAEQSGDHATARSLRSQLKSTHQDNISEMKTDKEELKSAHQELKSDRKAARTDRVDANDDGAVDRTERKAFHGARGGRR